MNQEHNVYIDAEKCLGCGVCQKDCPASNILMTNKKAKVIAQDCIKCGHCVAICPQAAVSITGFDNGPEEVENTTALEPQTLLSALKTRRSIRQFTREPVAPKVIAQIIEAGRLTPTGGNTQNVSFIVLKDAIHPLEKIAVKLFRRRLPLLKLVSPVARRTVIDDDFFFKKAPVAIMVLSPDKVNGALAAANMALMAEANGLGVLYSGFFSMAANQSLSLRRKLALKHGDKVVTTLVLGYAKVNYRRTAPKETAVVKQF